MLKFLLSNVSAIWGTLSTLALGWFVKRNSELKTEVKQQDKVIAEHKEIIEIQEKQKKLYANQIDDPSTVTARMRKRNSERKKTK